jgi:Rieske Fe-S protein
MSEKKDVVETGAKATEKLSRRGFLTTFSVMVGGVALAGMQACTPPDNGKENTNTDGGTTDKGTADKKTDGGAEPKPEPSPEPRPEPRPEPKPEPSPEPRPEPKPEPTPEPTPEPAPELTPDDAGTPEPTPEPQPEPRPEPKPEPRPELPPKPPGTELDMTKTPFSRLKTVGASITYEEKGEKMFLIRTSANEIVAINRVCTHAACDMKNAGGWDGTKLKCTCHGSQFSKTGQVLRGPAGSPLKTYKVTFDKVNDKLYVVP